MALNRVGRIKTAPLPASTAPVRFVWTGDSNAFFKPYTVLDPMLGDDPDVWFYIGDTIYGDAPRSGTGVAVTRADYHTKYKRTATTPRCATCWPPSAPSRNGTTTR